MTSKNVMDALDRAIAELESKSSSEVFDFFYERSSSFRNMCKDYENFIKFNSFAEDITKIYDEGYCFKTSEISEYKNDKFEVTEWLAA